MTMFLINFTGMFYTFEYLSSHKNIKNVKSIVGVSPTMV